MVNLSASTLIVLEHSDCTIERPCDKLPTGWGKVNVSNCTDVVLVDNLCLVHSSEIETVTVGVVISHSEVDRFQWVECHTHALIGKSNLLDWSFGSQVIQDETSITATT